MNVLIAVTKPCHHCQILERELKAMNMDYEIKYLEDNPEIVEKFNIRSSPNLIVDDLLVFQKMPELDDLRGFFKGLATREFIGKRLAEICEKNRRRSHGRKENGRSN